MERCLNCNYPLINDPEAGIVENGPYCGDCE
jgi:hypothetical protein